METRSHELRIISALTLCAALSSFAYRGLEIAREPLVLLAGPDLRPKLIVGCAVMLVLLVPLYSAIASRLTRTQLVCGVHLVAAGGFAAMLGCRRAGLDIGAELFIWFAAFHALSLASLWALAIDLAPERAASQWFGAMVLASIAGSVAGTRLVGLGIQPAIGSGSVALALVALLVGILARGAPARVVAAPASDAYVLLVRQPYLRNVAAWIGLATVVQVLAGSGDLPTTSYELENALALVGLLVLVVVPLRQRGFHRLAILVPVAATLCTALAVVTRSSVPIAVVDGVQASAGPVAYAGLLLTVSREAKYKARAALDLGVVTISAFAAGALVEALASSGIDQLRVGSAALASLVWIAVAIATARVPASRR